MRKKKERIVDGCSEYRNRYKVWFGEVEALTLLERIGREEKRK